MAIPGEQFVNLRFFRSPVPYFLPVNYEGYWDSSGPIIDDQVQILTQSLIVPETDSEAFIGESEQLEETFECYIERQTVYSFKLVNSLYDAPCFNLTISAPAVRNKIMSDQDYFSPQFPNDVKTLAFDFRKFLRKGENIITTDWTSEVEQGEDPDAEFLLQGAPEIVGTESRHSVGNGVVDTKYKLTCQVETDQNNTHTLVGYILIRELE